MLGEHVGAVHDVLAEIDLPHAAVVVGVVVAVFELEGVVFGYGQVFLVGEVGDVAGLGGGGLYHLLHGGREVFGLDRAGLDFELRAVHHFLGIVLDGLTGYIVFVDDAAEAVLDGAGDGQFVLVVLGVVIASRFGREEGFFRDVGEAVLHLVHLVVEVLDVGLRRVYLLVRAFNGRVVFDKFLGDGLLAHGIDLAVAPTVEDTDVPLVFQPFAFGAVPFAAQDGQFVGREAVVAVGGGGAFRPEDDRTLRQVRRFLLKLGDGEEVLLHRTAEVAVVPPRMPGVFYPDGFEAV